MSIRTWIGYKPPKRINTTRIRKGVREALFGGYAVWRSRVRKDDPYSGIRHTKEVRIWAPSRIDETDCGSGTKEIVSRLLKKVDPTGKRKAVIEESWRY